MEIVCNVDCTSVIAATATISAPCFTNFLNFESAPLTSSWRSSFNSLLTKRSTNILNMFNAGWAFEPLAFSPTISSLDFFALSHKRRLLSCTSMRNFRVLSSGANFFLSSSSSFSFSFFLASSSSAFSSSVFLSSASSSFKRSFISWSSWNFSGSPPLSGWSSSAIFLYILLISPSDASGGSPRKESAERFARPLRLAFAPSRHFWILLISASNTSVSCWLM
mmetsp:Transcript_103480/g.316788  ORF Transcript_103480/g.316788 Transcript_103480/m.316788 type:complete len:222 (+) Transcript_103480:239-904(+)